MIQQAKPLRKEEVLNVDFDWSFSNNNQRKPIPNGIIKVVACHYPMNDLGNLNDTRVAIIHDVFEDTFFVICQVRFWDHNWAYKEKYRYLNNLQLTDLKYKHYNVEWQFELPQTLWKYIKLQLGRREGPLYPTGTEIVKGFRRTFYIRNSADYTIYNWNDERVGNNNFYYLKKVADWLLDVAVEKAHLAYWINPHFRKYEKLRCI